MILHSAVFTWVPEVTAEDVVALTAALESMAAGIPEIRSYRCGESLRLRAGSADFGVVALVDDEAGLSAYLDSAAHALVYEQHLGRMIATRAAVQLTVPDDATL